jgi:pyruvate kinase
VLKSMLASGVSVARFNFSHAEHERTAEVFALIRRLADEAGLNVAILADLQGPRVRVGDLPEGGVTLTPGTTLTLDTQQARYSPGIIPVDYSGLARDVYPDDTILLDEGLICLKVVDVAPEDGCIVCNVVVGGVLTSNKGINVPNRPLGVPTITGKDRADLSFAMQHGADMVALSFVRTGSDIVEARKLITGMTERQVPIIAKIEKASAVENFAEILAEADGVMVARGDMGVEMPPEVLPAIQKRIIAAANIAAKPVITATQMLDSMIRNPRPTRAEATDVANAVLDGSDGIMLSGETATGKYPLEAVQTMSRIALEAEKLFNYDGWTDHLSAAASHPNPANNEIAELICQAADHISDKLNAKAVIALTHTGTSARLISKNRPRSNLLAVTDRPDTRKALAVTWGARVLLLDSFTDTLSTMSAAQQAAIKAGLVEPGDLLVFVGGLGQPLAGQTNLLQVQVAGTPTEQA